MDRRLYPKLHVFSLILGTLGLLTLLPGCPISDLTLPGINQDPTADAGADITIDVGQRVTLNGLGSTDADDDPLTFSWQQRSGPSVTLDGPNTVQPSFVSAEDGFYEFALTVTDGRGGSDISVVRVFVGDVDPATCPRADAGTDQTVNEGAGVRLRGGNSADPGGEPLTFDWFQLSGPQVSINGVFIAEPSFAAPQVTGADIELEFELTVTNEHGCPARDTVVITVRDRDASDPCNGLVCNDDGLFCNGVESCDGGICVSSGDPCSAAESCDEQSDACTAAPCDTDVDCDDGLFCNGTEICTNGVCQPGAVPCAAVQWEIEAGGNGHFYDLILLGSPVSWDDARAAAQAMGPGWDLVTLASPAENEFVESLFSSKPSFFNTASSGTNQSGPWIGGFNVVSATNFTWVTGEPVTFTDWGPSEPFGNGQTISYTDFSSPFGDGSGTAWNDIGPGLRPDGPIAFVAEVASESSTSILACDEDTHTCTSRAECDTDADCDDTLFCNGTEACVGSVCQDGTGPCAADETCDEQSDACMTAPCDTDADCDDGLFCNGAEVCVDGLCEAGTPPCAASETCDENADSFLQIVDINAKANAANNPIVVHLAAGEYEVVPISVDDGGAYTAWSNHLGSANTWLHRYTLSSGEFPTQEPGGTEPAFADANEAFAHAVSTTFTLANAADVNFFVCDGPSCFAFAGDNVGGISLQVSSSCLATAPSECDTDVDCDDGLFCNGTETCGGDFCQTGAAPCTSDETCDEATHECTPSTDTIGSSEWLTGSIDSVVDIDFYTFTGEAGQLVFIQANRTAGEFNPVIDLFPPNGGDRETFAGSPTGSIALLFAHPLAESGQYTIAVRDWSADGTGDYILSLMFLTGALTSPQDQDGGAIAFEETRSGTVDPVVDMDAYTFTGQAGQIVFIQANRTAGGLNPVIDLFPPNGGGRETFAGSPTGNIALLFAHQLAESGQYTIIVRDWSADGTGDYVLSLSALP